MKRSIDGFGSLALCCTLASSLSSLAGCDSEPSDGEDVLRRQLLRSFGEDVQLPLYRDFETKSGELDELARAFCDAPSNEALGAVRDAWWRARGPWKQAETVTFGPYIDFPLRLGPLIDFWPIRPDTIEETLNGSDPLPSDGLEAIGASAKGLPAIEYLLYQPGFELSESFQTVPRRCEYLVALTADLSLRARDMREAWDPDGGDYVAQLTDAGQSSQSFDSLQMALSELMSSTTLLIEVMQADKLGTPAGTKNGGTPQPASAESQYSDRAIEDMRDNLRGVEQLYFGADAEEAFGFDDYLRQRGRTDFDPRVRALLDDAFEALDRIPHPYVEAVVIDPFTMTDAIDKLRPVQGFLQVDVANVLGLSLRLFDNDGD